MNSAAKGKRLEAKSRRWLKADGALTVFRGKGDRRTTDNPGCAQVDLIAIYSAWIMLVEVTVPANRARARKRLKKFNFDPWVLRHVHIWRTRAKEPDIEIVE